MLKYITPPQLRLQGPHASLGANNGEGPLSWNQMSVERRKKKTSQASRPDYASYRVSTEWIGRKHPTNLPQCDIPQRPMTHYGHKWITMSLVPSTGHWVRVCYLWPLYLKRQLEMLHCIIYQGYLRRESSGLTTLKVYYSQCRYCRSLSSSTDKTERLLLSFMCCKEFTNSNQGYILNNIQRMENFTKWGEKGYLKLK